MSISFSQTTTFTCPTTQKDFDVELWLIIAQDERPDLIAKVKDGTIHQISSPFTQEQVGEMDVPLMIYQGERLLISPAQNTTIEEDQEQMGGLLSQLSQTLGQEAVQNLLQANTHQFPRQLLGIAIDDLSAAQHQLQTAINTQQGSPNPQALLQEIQELTHPQDLPRRIELLQQLLGMVPRERNPEGWATLHVELGNSYQQNPHGNRRGNLEAAIGHYEQAHLEYTRSAYPEQWAMTHNNLGTAYSDRIEGERRGNLEAAIGHFQQALEVRTRSAYPADWAMTHNNLGTAYWNRIEGERRGNLEAAIGHFQQALEVRTRSAYPEQWQLFTTIWGLRTAIGSRERDGGT